MNLPIKQKWRISSQIEYSLSKNIFILIFMVILFSLAITGCGNSGNDVEKNSGANNGSIVNTNQEQEQEIEEQESNDEEAAEENIESNKNGTEVKEQSERLSETQLAELQINELGQVMVLMYHVIGDKEGDWARTRENFRNDLQRLYDLGYRTVTMTDYLNGNIDIPAGTTPVIFTFDDGTIGQFRYLEEDGKLTIDPDSAVGIMLNFAEKNPDFGNAASFYINFSNPFGQPKYWKEKLQFLAANGMEIGNHSYNHANLSRLTDEEVQRELALQVAKVQEAIPGYPVNSLALPFGISAQNKALEMKGEYQGAQYNHLAVLRVGSNPGYPPGHQKFDPTRVPRVQAIQSELDKWLAYFEKNPQLKYVSDGNKDTLAIPEREQDKLDQKAIGSRELLIYRE